MVLALHVTNNEIVLLSYDDDTGDRFYTTDYLSQASMAKSDTVCFTFPPLSSFYLLSPFTILVFSGPG